MTENKISQAQLRASKKYNKENRDYLRVRDYRSKGLNFIRNHATLEDLEQFRKIIDEKEKQLKDIRLTYVDILVQD